MSTEVEVLDVRLEKQDAAGMCQSKLCSNRLANL